MKLTYFLLSVATVIALLATACGSAATPAPATSAPTSKATTAASNDGWQQKWDKVLADGRKEGVVTVYTSWKPATRTEFTQAFKARYGIDLEFSPFSGTTEIVSKAIAENRAGLYLADVFGTGVVILTAKNDNIMGPMDQYLILPEVRDPNAWLGGALPFVDKDKLAFSMTGVLLRNLLYNPTMLKEGELTSYKDLLKPQYKGKIVSHDPSVAGASNSLITNLGTNVWGEAQTVDFLTRLVKEQGAVITRDYRANIESLAKEKYAIDIAPDTAMLAEFINLGAPVKAAMIEDDSLVATASGGVAVPPKVPHPNATAVFLNWLLGKEAQSIFAKTTGNPVRRLDASTEGINPMFIPSPGKKYFRDDLEESMAAKSRWMELAKKTIDAASK